MEDFGGIMETLCAPRWQDRKPGLDRMAALLALLGDPQKQLRFVHITGTNGKGSTAAMLAAVLTAAGYSLTWRQWPRSRTGHPWAGPSQPRSCGRAWK